MRLVRLFALRLAAATVVLDQPVTAETPAHALAAALPAG